MKTTWLFLVLLAVGPLVALRAMGAVSTAPAKPSLAGRIDALLRPHLKPTSLPVTLPNPFVVVRGSAELTDNHEAAEPEIPAPETPVDPGHPTDAEVLARAVSRIKIGGTMHVNDQTQLMINGDLYREGDPLTLENKPNPIYAQIVRLTPSELTLRYKDATQTVRLKNPPKPRDPGP
jgi:hypothetical protein